MGTEGDAGAGGANELKERIARCLSGRSFSLGPDALGVPAIETVLRGLFDQDGLRMMDAELSSTEESVVLSGRATVFQVPNARVTATFLLGGQPALILSATGFPTTWKLSTSFTGMAGTLLDSLALRNPVIGIDSRNPSPLEQGFQVALGLPSNPPSAEKYVLRGLTLQAEVDLGPLNAVAWLLAGQRVEVRGPMELKGNAVRAWLRSEPLSPFEIAGFSFPFEVQLISWLEEASSSGAQGGSAGPAEPTPTPTPRTFARLASTATWRAKDSTFTLPVAAMVDSPAMDALTLEAGLEDVSRLAFPQLSKAMGVADLMGQVGGAFPSLDGVTIQRVAVTLTVATQTVSRLGVSVRLEKTVDLLPGDVTLGGFTLHFNLVQPGTAQSQLYAAATIDAKLFGARFTGNLTLPRMRFTAALNAGESIDLASLVERLLPEVKGPPLSCQSFRVYGTMGQPSLSMYIELDGSWRIPIGVTGLVIESLVLNMEHDRSGGGSRTRGFVGGDVSLGGDILINALWQIPGGLFLRGTIPDLQLMEVVERLCGSDALEGIPVVKDVLGVELSDVTITADFKTNTFGVSATADQLGRAELFIEKPAGGGWGLGLGVYLTSGFRFSRLGSVLAPLDGFRISNPYVVVSTFQARELALPDQPKGYATRMQRGVNMYLPILLEPKGALSALKKVLGNDGASLVLSGAFNEGGCRLEAAMAGFDLGGGVTFESAGFRLAIETDGDLSLSVFGRLAVKLKDRLTFAGELMLQPNGATLSATMEGTWRTPFGIPGFTLSNVALALGVSLEGLPTVGLAGTAVIGRTPGSFAVLINSVDPAESVLSLRFAKLELSMLFEAAISPDVRKKIPDELMSLLDTGYEDVDVYLVPESTYIGSLYYPQGFRFKATTSILGWRAAVDASLGFASGIKLQGSTEPLRLGLVKGTYAFELTAARADLLKTLEQKAGEGKEQAPESAVSARPLGGPRLRASLSLLEPPSLYLSCRAALLGFIEQEVLAQADASGVKLALSQKQGSTELALTCQVGRKGLDASGRFVFALVLDTRLDVPGAGVSLGRLKLSTALEGSLALLITANVFRAEVTGGFSWEGTKLEIPKVVLSATVSDVKQLIAEVTREIGQDAYEILKPAIGKFDDYMGAVDKGLVQIGKAAGQSADQLGDALRKTFRGVSAEQTARALRKGGHTAQDTARYIEKSWNDGEDAVRAALKGAGFSSSDIEDAAGALFGSAKKVVEDVGTAAKKTGKKIGKLLKKL